MVFQELSLGEDLEHEEDIYNQGWTPEIFFPWECKIGLECVYSLVKKTLTTGLLLPQGYISTILHLQHSYAWQASGLNFKFVFSEKLLQTLQVRLRLLVLLPRSLYFHFPAYFFVRKLLNALSHEAINSMRAESMIFTRWQLLNTHVFIDQLIRWIPGVRKGW